MRFVNKYNTKLLWIAFGLMFTVVLIPVSALIFVLLMKDMKQNDRFGNSITKKREKILELNTSITDLNKVLKDLMSQKESLLIKYKEEAKTFAASEMIEINEVLPGLYDELNAVRSELDKSNKTVISNAAKVQKLQTQAKSIKFMLKRYNDNPEFVTMDDDIINNTDELLSTAVELRLHYMDIRQLKTLFNQNKQIINDTLKKYKSRYTTKALSALYNLMVLALDAELQNILFSLRFGKLDDALKNIRAIAIKYQQIASDGNQNIAPTVEKFIAEIEYLYTEAVKIEYEYYTKKEAIKEEQRALREQMRIEAEDRKRNEEELRRIENEETKFNNEISNITEQLLKNTDEEEKKALHDRLNELNIQRDAVEHRRDEIVKLQHGKAGFVYIISNLGSFGKSAFKIGMTRRSNPQERIDELSSASVPFPFDIHSLIFSNDAVELEKNLHKSLHSDRINKVNMRKEFFNTSVKKLEELVISLQPTAEFKHTMLAEQYHQSLSIGNDEIPDNVIELFNEDENEPYNEAM